MTVYTNNNQNARMLSSLFFFFFELCVNLPTVTLTSPLVIPSSLQFVRVLRSSQEQTRNETYEGVKGYNRKHCFTLDVQGAVTGMFNILPGGALTSIKAFQVQKA